jgi:hypothetical protein
MVRILRAITGLLIAAVLGAGCVQSPLVVQGKVLSYDAQSKNLVVEDERNPGQSQTFSMEVADMGGEPAVGDLVRLAYHEEGNRLVGIRLMNLSHQSDLMKKG